jgi:integrase/recombinase XerD
MSDKPISDLRRRMIADMRVRTFGDKTQHDYIRHIEAFARFLGRSPDSATGDDIRRFQLAQVEGGAQPPKMNAQASALRFFFTITLGRADLAHQLARTHYPRKLPRVLTPDQVARLLETAPGPGLKYKAALGIAYGAGLRGGEVVMLRVGDIDSERMLIRVEMGKGRKDRHAMLSPQLLSLLRAWWLQCRSRGWLFPGRDPLLPITVRQLNRVCHMAAEAAGLGSWVTPHTLRHSFATPAGERYRRAGDSSAAGPCQARHDRPLYSRRHQRAAHGDEPARSAEAAEGGTAGITPVPDGPSSPGSRGYLPRPRARLA